MKSLKSIFYFSFILDFFLSFKKEKKVEKITQHKNISIERRRKKKKEKEERKRRKKKIKRKLIKIAIGILHTSHILSSIICHLWTLT